MAADTPALATGQVVVRVNKAGAKLFIDGKPHTIIGSLGGYFKQGQLVQYAKGTPHNVLLTAIGQAAAMVSSGQVRTALVGGVEMMSRVPFMADSADYYTDATMPARRPRPRKPARRPRRPSQRLPLLPMRR